MGRRLKFPTVIKAPFGVKFDFFLCWWQHLSRVPRHWFCSGIIIQDPGLFRRLTKNSQPWAVAHLTPIREVRNLISLMAMQRQSYPRRRQERRWTSNVLLVSFWGKVLHESYIHNRQVTCLIRALWLEMKENVEFTWISSGHPRVVKFLSFHCKLCWEICEL